MRTWASCSVSSRLQRNGLAPGLRLGAWCLLGLAGLTASAHEVHEHLGQATATVLTLRYADGEPFAGETYQLFAPGAGTPTLSGRSDRQGRVVFLAEPPGRWRVRSFSDDGHGLETTFEAGAGADTPAAAMATTPAGDAGASRSSRIFFGLGLVLALFGGLQLFLRRRPPAG